MAAKNKSGYTTISVGGGGEVELSSGSTTTDMRLLKRVEL